MSFSLYLFFREDCRIRRREIAEFVRDGCYFDDPVSYEPSTQGQLGELTIKYAPSRSIQLRLIDRKGSAEIIEEAIESLANAPISVDLRDRLRKRLTETRSAVEVQVDRAKMDENSWAMLDALEADLMRSNNGLLYVYGEGIYGPDLHLWPEVV